MDFSCSIATSSHCPEQLGHCCRDFSAGLSGDSSRHKIERDARCGEEQWQWCLIAEKGTLWRE